MNLTEVKKRGFYLKTLTVMEQLSRLAGSYSREITLFILGFVLSFGRVSGASIFGTGLLCACGREKGRRLERVAVFLGICLSAFFADDGVFFVVASAVSFSVLFLFSLKGKEGDAETVIASLCASILFLPLGFSAFVASVIGLPVFSLAFSGLFHRGRAVSPFVADSGFFCLAFAFVLSLSGRSFGIFDYGMITAVFFCLEGGERGGYFSGALAGFFGGLALGMEYVPPLVMGGFLCGAFTGKKRLAGISLFCVTCLIYGWLYEGLLWTAYAFNPIWGCLLWVAVSELFADKKRIKMPLVSAKSHLYGDTKLSEAFGSISLALNGLSKAKKREREEKIRRVVDGVFCAECETCTGCKMPTEQLKQRICRNLLKNKKTTENDFSESFRDGCSRWKFIVEKINGIMEESPVKTSLRIDTLAEDYTSMWRILSFGERRAENRFYRDVSLGNKIKLELELKNLRVMKVEVYGERLPTAEIWGIPFKLPFPEKLIQNRVERVLGKEVSLMYLEAEGKTAKMGFKAKCPMKADFYKISIPKKGEVICGDSVSVFEGDDGYFYSIISDGMGSGRDAAVCSRLGTVFLEKLVAAGIDKSFAVSMLGNVVSSSEDEVFTTVDLLEADLVRGKLTFIKAGSSPSWILRNRRAYRITSKTMPCGIIRGTSAEQTILDCFPGDLIIMASDGGECAVEDGIKEIFKENRSLSPKETALYLADVATEKNGRNDDVTFCVVYVT